MKRHFREATVGLLIVVLLLSMCSCGSSAVTQSEGQKTEQPSVSENNSDQQSGINLTDNRKPAEEEIEETAPAVSDSDFSIKEYKYEDMFSTQYFLIIKNNSQVSVSVNANGVAKDAEGNSIGAATAIIDVLGPNEESLTYFYFNDVTGVATVEYQISYSTDLYYEPVVSNLSIDASINDTNVIATVTNNGSVPAEFVQGDALFFDADNNVIYHNNTFFTDNDSEIKPGASISGQIDSFEPFDHVELYFSGRHTDF